MKIDHCIPAIHSRATLIYTSISSHSWLQGEVSTPQLYTCMSLKQACWPNEMTVSVSDREALAIHRSCSPYCTYLDGIDATALFEADGALITSGCFVERDCDSDNFDQRLRHVFREQKGFP